MMRNRRHGGISKVYVQKQIAPGLTLFIPKTDDLEPEELQAHFDWAMDSEDYEYAEAINAEAIMRGQKLVWK